MHIHNIIQEAAAAAFQKLYDVETDPQTLQVQETRKEFEGDYTLVVFPLTRHSHKSPEQTATDVGEQLIKLNEIETYSVAKGFLNLTIAQSFWHSYLKEAIAEKDLPGFAKPEQPKTIMVEYSSPNTNKPLHLGHIRNILLGYSIAEILKARSHNVIKANLVNDRGIHICKSMLAWQKFGEGKTPESEGIKGDHFVGDYYVVYNTEYQKEMQHMIREGAAPEEAERNAPIQQEARKMLSDWERNDPQVRQLWETMNGWVYEGFEKTYETLGVDFDKFYYESETYLLGKELVLKGLEKGVFFKKEDGSIWVDLADEGLDQKLLLRADGTSVYITQDLGTAQLKFDDYRLDQSVYVVGNEQDYHFKVLSLILKKLEHPVWDKIYHLSYGMVDLPTGKMKSREGTVVDADDLMLEMFEVAEKYTRESGKLAHLEEDERQKLYRQIGLAALKFFILSVDPKKRMTFNPQASIDFQGHTGPFIQYSYARIHSLLAKAKERGLASSELPCPELHSFEIELIKLLYHFGDKLQEAETQMSPAVIAEYGFELAKSYNKFYHELPILPEPDEQKRQFRLRLSEKVGTTLINAMKLLGIEMPERM
ncbi:MAG: arginine--tRNA ligase [Bacteroidia bacterium]